MTEINMLEAKTNLTKMIRDLESKVEDEYLICRNGKPCAILLPYNKIRKNRVGCCEGKYPEISFDDWQKMDDDLLTELNEWENTEI